MRTRKSFWFKCITVFVGLNLLTQTFYPTIALALTGGPSQPEMQAFEPVGTSNMVDLSTGSFTYNIPLLDVEGYPINLSYHSGVTMDQEASWVGLGWNINPGEINRQMRGLPDDFNGDPVTEQFNLKDNMTIGLSAGVALKLFGLPIKLSNSDKLSGKLNLNAGIFYNNYKGPGLTLGVTPSLATGNPNKSTLNCSLGINFNSQSGVDISPSLGFSQEVAHASQYNGSAEVKVGSTYNSRTGVKGLQMTKDFNVSHTGTKPVLDKDGNQVMDADGKGETKVTDHEASGLSSSTSMSFSGPTYIPTIHMPISNYAVTLDATLGAAFIGAHPDFNFSGWFNDQTLSTHSQTLSAYGYMYADQANNNPYALHDFNREKDIPFLPHIANLPITNFTYDLYSINGEGVSGQFRPFRGDVGILYDHENHNTSLSASLGIELGVGDAAHNGIEANVSTSNTVTDQWLGDNQFASTVSFKSLQPDNINYEPFYIKRVGEKTVNDQQYYNAIGDVNPVYVNLNHSGEDVTAMSIFNINNTTMNVGSNLIKTRREKRNQCTSILNAQEANNFALDKEILSYPLNTNVYASKCDSATKIVQISRITGPRQLWHTSEITVTNPDGKRYVYGLPAYNIVHKEATFAVGGSSLTPTTDDHMNIVGYAPGDNSTGNSEGLDNYFDEQSIPPYAHSYLLTGVLSPDYVDMTGDGITDDDLGQAVKINYSQVYSQSNPYQWRVPFEANSGNYQKGTLSNSQDDKGNYLYGQKEMWYVHSIESKTMVAQFILGNRQDGYGVQGENGGLDNTRPLKYLEEIQLYSKADLIAHGSKAVPIKTVHFVYDYSLCPGTSNSLAPGGGKLTLKEVYFTYGNNTEGSLNSYQFNYNGINPSFSHDNYDRWGNYKKPNSVPGLSNEDFPYSTQIASTADSVSTAWNMTDIDLPSGGHITVQYESNDYAYLQNQRAGQMFIIDGMSSYAGGGVVSQLFSGNILSTFTWNNWVNITLPVAETNPSNFYNDYLAGVGTMYFRFAVDVDGSGHYEYVSGYAPVNEYKQTSTDGLHWALQLANVSTGDPLVGSANPISMATWQFLRLNLPQYAYPGSQTTGPVYNMILAVFGIFFDVLDMFLGFDGRVASQGAGQNIIANHSWVRLDNPTYQKFGGGTRVKEIDIADNWASMASGQSSYTYGQTYNYTTTLSVNNTTKTISSGVATYEPLQGGDENSLKQPLPYDEKYILAPNNEFYTETPLGETLYPSPGIIYSKVTVTNLQHPGIERTATGYTVNDFYTSYDFPVLNNWTSLDNIHVKPNLLTTLLNFSVKDYTTVSQGFTIEVNDMPGKEKGQEIYDQTGSEISSVHYYYHTDNPYVPSMHLNNNVNVVNPDGTVTGASIGKDIDTYEDMREQETTTKGYGGTFNSDFFIFPFFAIPIDIPDIIPSYSSEDTRFRSAVTTKYIYRSGLIDSVVNMKYGSYVTTQNVAYDGETGNVLLTQTHNEFNEPLYNFTYPAHFAYAGMGSEYQNIGFVYNNVYLSGGQFVNPTNSVAAQYFTPGDQLEYTSPMWGLTDTLLWVTQPRPGGILSVMDITGHPVTLSNVQLKIIHSGHVNMACTPIGSVETMNSPIVGGNISIGSGNNVLQSNATIFSDAWPVPTNNLSYEYCYTPDTSIQSPCVTTFLDSILVNHQLFATASDSIFFGTYLHTNPSCNSTNMRDLFYCMSPPTWTSSHEYYEAMIGNCLLTISTLGGPVDFDSLSPFVNHVGGIMDRADGCLLLWRHNSITGDTIGGPAAIECFSCRVCGSYCGQNINPNTVFNPYAIGMLGDWRPERNYVYYTNRSPVLTASTSNIWNNGVLEQYSPIWGPPGAGNIWPLDTLDKNWTWTSLIDMYDQKGNEIEDMDALGRYSSAIYGYLQSLPVAVSSNAKYKDIAFDGMEDYGFLPTCNTTCDNYHFSFSSLVSYYDLVVDTSSALAHTGKYSLWVKAHNKAEVTYNINYFNDSLYRPSITEYTLLAGGSIPEFSPESGKYLISAWVNENNNCTTSYKDDSIMVSFTGSSALYKFHSSGTILDGWQRFEGTFNVPTSATKISVSLVAGNNSTFYDDIRIQPFAAEMKTYVYDPTSLRLMATLDENNYATFYEYSDEGILMRVKKETEKGIMTIKESRSSYKRQ